VKKQVKGIGMKVKKKGLLVWAVAFLMALSTSAQEAQQLLLKDFEPRSIFNIPVTEVTRARFPVIDVHAHQSAARTEEEIGEWVKTMDRFGIRKTIILATTTGAAFDSICRLYARYGDRFEVWCGFDYTGYDQPGYGPAAVKELERCYRAGARGVGELGDKGKGMFFSQPVKAWGMHCDDPRLKPLFEKCAELKMPVNIHIADPYWMYLPMDRHNDGLMNAAKWQIDSTRAGTIGFHALLRSLENVVRENPKTTFIACHFANCNHDLELIARLLDLYPNLYLDNSARFALSGPIPRTMKKFYSRYAGRIMFGTDNGRSPDMYGISFRILETTDEHFYYPGYLYHWSYSGLDLGNRILKRIYYKNAKRILHL